MTHIAPNPYISYKHLEAKSTDELELKMLTISIKSNHPPTFSPPTFSNGKWHTWYLFDWATLVRPQDKLKMENEDGDK